MGKSTAPPKQQSMAEIDNLKAICSVTFSATNCNTALYEKNLV